jgi:hypothetical protein
LTPADKEFVNSKVEGHSSNLIFHDLEIAEAAEFINNFSHNGTDLDDSIHASVPGIVAREGIIDGPTTAVIEDVAQFTSHPQHSISTPTQPHDIIPLDDPTSFLNEIANGSENLSMFFLQRLIRGPYHDVVIRYISQSRFENSRDTN